LRFGASGLSGAQNSVFARKIGRTRQLSPRAIILSCD
jgi:hypothetical protein